MCKNLIYHAANVRCAYFVAGHLEMWTRLDWCIKIPTQYKKIIHSQMMSVLIIVVQVLVGQEKEGGGRIQDFGPMNPVPHKSQ